MINSRFWTLLAMLTGFVMASLLCTHYFFPDCDAFSPFTMICVAIFVMINVMAYLLGKVAARSQNKYLFIQLMMILIIVKMAICIGLVVLYMQTSEAPSKAFVWPFFGIYLAYTFFEVYVLEKLAHLKPTEVGQVNP